MSVKRKAPNIPPLFVNQNFKISKTPTQQQHMSVLVFHWPNSLTNRDFFATENPDGRARRFSRRVEPFHNAEA
jgi:hypothetical protein